MTKLDLKKIQVELIRVGAAKAELELRVDELTEEINRLNKHIEVQLNKEMELQEKISKAQLELKD